MWMKSRFYWMQLMNRSWLIDRERQRPAGSVCQRSVANVVASEHPKDQEIFSPRERERRCTRSRSKQAACAPVAIAFLPPADAIAALVLRRNQAALRLQILP